MLSVRPGEGKCAEAAGKTGGSPISVREQGNHMANEGISWVYLNSCSGKGGNQMSHI